MSIEATNGVNPAMLRCPRPAYRAWLVDLDGTLYRASYVRLAMALELAAGHWKAAGTLRVFRQQHERLRAECKASSNNPYQQQIEHTADLVNRTPREIESLVSEWMQRRPGKWLRAFRRRKLLHTISRFHDGGGRTALVSDYPARAKLDALGIRSLFDVVVANGELDVPVQLKPSPEGYLLASQRLQVEPKDCLVIGDRMDADGIAAQRAGMAFELVSGWRSRLNSRNGSPP